MLQQQANRPWRGLKKRERGPFRGQALGRTFLNL
jgi:hypothetical protein